MHTSPYKLHRLASDQIHDRLAAAAHRRTVRLARIGTEDGRESTSRSGRSVGIRTRIADGLVGLAARLSPAHRDVLCAVRPSACTPVHG